MNGYLKNLNKIEFVVTDACTGSCKHCSEGDHMRCGERIDPALAADVVKRVAEIYPIKTVMAFGGEPLLYPDAVYSIIGAARDMNIEKRQLITNGYFSNDGRVIEEVAERLFECGVNDLLLSVDAFHQETIPLTTVRKFAEAVRRRGIPTRLQPAWLVSPTHKNPYNEKTRIILDSFLDTDIPVGEGNTVFPEGNAKKYLAEYFTEIIPENPYIDDPCDVKCLSFSANGDVLSGNAYRESIVDIINSYDPRGKHRENKI